MEEIWKDIIGFDMKIAKYKARIEKERLGYIKLAESFEKKLKELE